MMLNAGIKQRKQPYFPMFLTPDLEQYGGDPTMYNENWQKMLEMMAQFYTIYGNMGNTSFQNMTPQNCEALMLQLSKYFQNEESPKTGSDRGIDRPVASSGRFSEIYFPGGSLAN